jgi:hypothetical protein
MLQLLGQIKAVLDFIGGVSEEPPLPSLAWMKGPLWWGLWWAVLILLIVAFSGQSSKFIYIDF